jgi:hypothetical protein
MADTSGALARKRIVAGRLCLVCPESRPADHDQAAANGAAVTVDRSVLGKPGKTDYSATFPTSSY